ncbi:MaoC/PaaZ C-terminal domain-containing protein [Malikia spinosa]|uniref:MaoC/PaaZ C-terminal domain-containing protein n=1 Tax=Malikia spinosa TaxID=86180 RepID=UPI0027B8CB17|nr:MaoC/PaaZ C-terminal domain-containing protein [Malikia spinosa]
MSEYDYKPRGMYFEDFEINKAIVTARRTVTLTDIVNFACLSGDHNAPHIDHEFCKTQPYGEPIAHAPLVLAIVGGLQCLSGINDGTVVAMTGLDQWRMHLPVKAGDTIHAVIIPKEKKLTSSGTKGIVTFERIVKNQRAEIVQSMLLSVMYKCRVEIAA